MRASTTPRRCRFAAKRTGRSSAAPSGQVFGNRPIWLFDPGWQAALDSTGSSDMMRWGRLFRSQRWFDLVPDQKHQVVTGGLGEFNGLDYLTAARTADGTLVMAYMPSARTITVDMTQIAGHTVRASWVDPSTGTARKAGRFTTAGSHEFTPPGSGDWVSILHSDAGGAGRS